MKKVLKSIARRFGFELRRIPPPPRHATFSDAVALDSDLLALKSFADRAARFSASPEQSHAVADLYLSGILREQHAPAPSRIEIGGSDTRQIGIWRKQSRAKDAPFVRMADSDWTSWARKETIEPKRQKWRVALIGESVARGYLYDPEFTPASVLEQMLRSHLGTAELEVVDLAMNSLTLQPLKTLIGQSLALSPDVIVVFAGNNWHRHLEESDIPYVEGPLRRHGVPRLKSYIDGKVSHAVRQLTQQVNAVVSGRDISLIWVVPESNLDDWHDPISNAPLLAGRGNREWLDLRARASQAFAEREIALAETLAREMVRLDGGTNSVPLRILAECRRHAADHRGTRQYLEMCRDADGWDPSFAYTPRTSVVIQEALREAASVPRNLVVDLPQIFSRYLDDRPPDRRLFLDYCHLTAEGIDLAMAAVGAAVVESIRAESVSIEKLQSLAPSTAAEVEGKACLLAAIHNAHYYQGHELAVHWCERALRFWPESAQVMKSFADFQTRRGDILACRSAMELRGTREFVALVRSGKKRLDLALVDAMAKSLASFGVEMASEISDLRAQEHSLGHGPKELTDFYYSSTMARPAEPGWTSKSFSTNRASHCIYASAYWVASKFVFFGESGRPVALKLTYRVPGQSGTAGRISIDVNGHRIAEPPAEATWRTFEIRVAGDHVIDGLNEVVITWPGETESSEALLDRAADALLARRIPHLYRVFGEIHSLLAFDPSARPTQTQAGLASSEATALPSSEAFGLVSAQ